MKAALKEGTGIASKRIKAIKLADKSEFGWRNVMSTCQTSWLQTPTTKKECIARREEGRKKIKDKRRRQPRPFTRGSSQPTVSNVSSNLQRTFEGHLAVRRDSNPSRRLGPCFKISI